MPIFGHSFVTVSAIGRPMMTTLMFFFFRADSHWDVWKESIKLSQAVWPLWRFLWKLAVSQPKIGQNRPKLAILENQCFSLNLTVILILHSKIGSNLTDISRGISKMAKQGTPIYPHFLLFWAKFCCCCFFHRKTWVLVTQSFYNCLLNVDQYLEINSELEIAQNSQKLAKMGRIWNTLLQVFLPRLHAGTLYQISNE